MRRPWFNAAGIIALCLFALWAVVMEARACAVCLPQRGHWDPVRGTLCHGEAP